MLNPNLDHDVTGGPQTDMYFIMQACASQAKGSLPLVGKLDSH